MARNNETSVRVKCSRQFKRDLRALAQDWDARKAGKFDMSGVLRTLAEREIRRMKRRDKKRRNDDTTS
ncbi:MAG: hypothetical protein JXB46_02920 [Candidatus Eisenbacteria bacterium]|nr:hypothetical protein [Candidatus Eisenbacteria bacterium]